MEHIPDRHERNKHGTWLEHRDTCSLSEFCVHSLWRRHYKAWDLILIRFRIRRWCRRWNVKSLGRKGLSINWRYPLELEYFSKSKQGARVPKPRTAYSLEEHLVSLEGHVLSEMMTVRLNRGQDTQKSWNVSQGYHANNKSCWRLIHQHPVQNDLIGWRQAAMTFADKNKRWRKKNRTRRGEKWKKNKLKDLLQLKWRNRYRPEHHFYF